MGQEITATGWATDPHGTAYRTLSDRQLEAFQSMAEPEQKSYANARLMGVGHNKAMGIASAAYARRIRS